MKTIIFLFLLIVPLLCNACTAAQYGLTAIEIMSTPNTSNSSSTIYHEQKTPEQQKIEEITASMSATGDTMTIGGAPYKVFISDGNLVKVYQMYKNLQPGIIFLLYREGIYYKYLTLVKEGKKYWEMDEEELKTLLVQLQSEKTTQKN